MAVEFRYRYDGVSKKELEAVAVPESDWGVEIVSAWDEDNPRGWMPNGEPEIWDDDEEDYVPNPDYDENDGNGWIAVRYGLRYNKTSGTYEKTKLIDFEYDAAGDTNLGVGQDEWVSAGSSGYTAFRQPTMSNRAVPYALHSYNESMRAYRVTTAADVSGTPLYVAGYVVGAQNMPDCSSEGWISSGMSMHAYPQNLATGLYFAYKNGKYGVVNDKGSVAIPFEYDAFCNNTFCNTSFALLKKGTAWEFVDLAQVKETLAPLPPAASTSPKLKSIAKARVTAGSKVYTGKKLKPSSVKVVIGGKTLKKGTDYTVVCAGGKKIGSYKVTIKGKGAYTGTAASTFLVTPKGTAVKRIVAAKKGFTVTWKKLSKMHRKQTTGYQIRYSTNKKFKKGVTTKTVKGASKLKIKVGKLKAKKTYYVQVRAYRKAGGAKYYSAWSKTVKVKTKRK